MTYFEHEKFRNLVFSSRGDLSLNFFSDEIGISMANLSRVENNKTISIDTFLAICNFLRVNPSDFFEEI